MHAHSVTSTTARSLFRAARKDKSGKDADNNENKKAYSQCMPYGNKDVMGAAVTTAGGAVERIHMLFTRVCLHHEPLSQFFII